MHLPTAALGAQDTTSSVVEIELTSTPPILRVRAADGGWLTVHSRRDPLAEAYQQLAHLEVGGTGVLVIVGAGLGFVTEAARARWPHARIVVVEPLASVAEAARARTPTLYVPGHVSVVAGPAFEGANDLWSAFEPHVQAGVAPPMFVHPVLGRALPGPMADAARVASRAMAAARMNAEARAQNAGRYLLNTLRNVRHLVNGADAARLQAQFTGAPAVVVGAGPSLDHQADLLRRLESRALVIATDTAWRPLVRAGVHPHLVVALDPSRDNGRHLVGIPHALETWVVSEGSVDPDALQEHAGRVAVFRVADHHPWPWLRQQGTDAPMLRAWGSVLTTAFDLAIVCGCSPIVFAGADLAFTDGQPYCRGTSHEASWARHAARGVRLRHIWRQTLEARTLIEVPGVAGAPVVSAPHLVEFRDWIVARAGDLDAGRVVNASGAGILVGPSLRQADLADTVKTFPDRDGGFCRIIHQRLARRPDRERTRQLREALSSLDGSPRAVTLPVDAWQHFGGPGLGLADIVSAARAAVSSLDAAEAPRTTDEGIAPQSRVAIGDAQLALRWHTADRVAAMRARLTGDTSGLDGGAAPTPSRAGAGAADVGIQAARLIDHLLAMPQLASEVGEDGAAGSPLHTIPLSMRFVWTDAAMPLVARLEELLLEIEGVDAASCTPRPEDGSYWTGPIMPVAAEDADLVPRSDNADALARHALIIERTLVLPGAVTSDRLRRFTNAVRDGLADPCLVSDATMDVHAAFLGGEAGLSLPLRPDALMRAATGMLARAQGSGDPRLTLLASPIALVEPTILTDQGLPRGWTIAAADRDHAIFTPGRCTQSVRISVEGSVTAGTTWPEAITGEVPWGGEGGALAWNAADSLLLWRRRPSADIGVARLSFRPVHVTVSGDTLLLADMANGIWRWSPQHEPARVATMPGSGIPRFEGDTLLVAPMVRAQDGRVSRRRLPYEWRIEPTTGACVETAARPAGQCAKVARRDRWTARSHPFADLVGLEREDGHALLLACYAPLGVAWAGSSLIVTSSDGAVLVFGRLLDRLDALVGDAGGGAHRSSTSTGPISISDTRVGACSSAS